MEKLFITVATVLALMVSCQSKKEIMVIPEPNSIERNYGYLNFKKIDGIISDNTGNDEAAKFIAESLSSFTGEKIIEKDSSERPIRLIYNNNIKSEGYILDVSRKGITIQSPDYAGYIHGMYTLMQLMPNELWGDSTKIYPEIIKIPCCTIEDSPRFSYRGLHLDVSRHFFTKDEIKRYIEILAIHKLNRFHWHLTDDPGWRLEIRKYPLLTSVAAWRADRSGDYKWDVADPQADGEICEYGGYYTQDDAREIVRYAKERAIEVIPEIEFPGHSCEVFSAYPTLSCSGKSQPVPTGGGPGYSKSPSSVFCAGKEEVFEFVKDVLTEVVEIFPDAPYIHIGGDEVSKLAWKQCRNCQRRMNNEGLQSEAELQSYFIKRVEKIAEDLGKPIIGWDEILEGGIAPNATIMSWRGISGGIQAAKEGHDVIMTPGSHLYFDHLQNNPASEPAGSGYLTTRKVYSYEPIPEELNEEEAKHVLGAQANLWTENVWTFDHVTYMALPRACALSEVVWSKTKDWNDFSRRLSNHQRRLENNGFVCHRGCTDIEINATYSDGKYIVSMDDQIYGAEIHYTLDGSEPCIDSKKYNGPITISRSTLIKALLFQDGYAISSVPTVQNISYHKGIGKRIIYNTPVSKEYSGKGDITLIDGLNSPLDLSSNLLQGFCEHNFDVTIDLEEATEINSLSVGFIQSVGAWVYLPSRLKVYTSHDGENFEEITSIEIENNPEEEPLCRRDVKVSFNTNARFVKVIGVNEVTEPGLPGGGKINWIFADEVAVD